MSLIKWRDSFATGVERFDSDHRRIVEMIAELYTGITGGADKKKIERTITELISYTKYHFTNEEEHMRLHDFPKRAEHRIEHEDFKLKLAEMQKKLEQGDREVPRQLYTLLRDWFSHHIMEVDRQYGSFFLEKGVR